jgi:hypothetical protein
MPYLCDDHRAAVGGGDGVGHVRHAAGAVGIGQQVDRLRARSNRTPCAITTHARGHLVSIAFLRYVPAKGRATFGAAPHAQFFGRGGGSRWCLVVRSTLGSGCVGTEAQDDRYKDRPHRLRGGPQAEQWRICLRSPRVFLWQLLLCCCLPRRHHADVARPCPSSSSSSSFCAFFLLSGQQTKALALPAPLTSLRAAGTRCVVPAEIRIVISALDATFQAFLPVAGQGAVCGAPNETKKNVWAA